MKRRRRKGVGPRLTALNRLLKSKRPRSALETLCIQRAITDLEHEGQNGLRWDEDEAVRNVEFFRLLRHWKGDFAGRAFDPQPYQEHLILAPLFGWYREDGRRRFTVGYCEQPRKQGKTTLAAGISLQGLVADGESGAEAYATATTRDQANILFRDAQAMIRQSPELLAHVQLFKHSITCDALKGSLQPLASDYNSLHGRNVSRAVIDELHSHKTRDLWDVIQTATAARRNPLVFAITTAGYDRSSICWEQHEYARQILEGNHRDDSYFAYIAAADPGDDPFDPLTWAKANPNLGVSVLIDYLKQEAHKARTSPAYENTFRRLHLNQWTEQAVRYLPMEAWDACAGDVSEADLIGRDCFAALDLASTRDLCAAAFLFPFEGGRFKALLYCWAPRDKSTARQKSDRQSYAGWEAKGLIRLTDGAVADYSMIRADLFALAERFNVRKLAFDPWNAQEFFQSLVREGWPEDRLLEFRQGFASYNEPTKRLLELVNGRNLEHGGNPVLRWMAGNLTVRQDVSGNLRPDKEKSSDKIDGMTALLMALGVALVEPIDDGESFYDQPDDIRERSLWV